MKQQAEELFKYFKHLVKNDELLKTLSQSSFSNNFVEDRLSEILREVFSRDRENFESKLIEKYGRLKIKLNDKESTINTLKKEIEELKIIILVN